MIQAAIQAAENGKEIALETAGYLSGIVQESKDSAALIEKISIAAEQQSESMDEVTKGVEQISNVIQMNSSTAEESAAASEELSGQAQIMNQLVSCFKLKAE
jgi:methyl-accepting chemotaxis protein